MPPKKKVCPGPTKTNETMKAQDGSSTGLIRLEINDVLNMTATGNFSPVIEVHGTPWKLGAWRTVGHASYLQVYLYHRQSNCDLWSFDVSAEITLVNVDSTKNEEATFTRTFNHEIGNWGFSDFAKWEYVVDEEKGFITAGKMVIEARITLSNMLGIRVTPRADFSDANEPSHDVALVVNGEKIHVNKGILSVHSPVFKTMFYGQFVEKGKKEVELKDVDPKELVDLLHLIYPSDGKITDANAEYLLKLADRFQINLVLEQVERFLINSTTMNVSSKLNLSDQFRLVNLQDHCLDSLKVLKDVTDLKATDGYKALSDKIKATLLEKVMKLTPAT